jgi:hypothetical protein
LEGDGVEDFAIYTGRSLHEGMEVAHVRYAALDHIRREPRFAFEIAIEEPGTPAMLRSLPNLLITTHHLIRDQVLKPLRPFF